MMRTTAAVAVVAMVVGLAPAAMAAGNKKKNQQRARVEPLSTSHATRTGDTPALRRHAAPHVQPQPQPRAAAPAPQPARPQPRTRSAPRTHHAPPAPVARSGGLGRSVLQMLGVGAVSFGTGLVIFAGFAALGPAAPLAALIGIPSALLLTGAVALISGATDGPTSPYAQYQDPRNVLRAAAFQQQRRRQQAVGSNNFPQSPSF